MSCKGSDPPYYISAYGIARKNGFKGTEKEWLNTLTAFYMVQKAGYAGTSEEWLRKLVDPLPEITIGEVITLAGGSMATVNITGTKEKPVLNFSIPRGMGKDDGLPLVGGDMKGPVNMQNHGIYNLPGPVNEGDAVPKKYVEELLIEVIREINEKILKKLSLSGDTMTGDLNMNGNRLYNIMEPTDDKDAVPKDYVETSIKTAVSGVKTKVVNKTLIVSGWSASAPYKQSIAITGLSDELHAKAYPVYPAALADKIAMSAETAKICNCTRSGNVMTFECWKEVPVLAIPIAVEVYV